MRVRMREQTRDRLFFVKSVSIPEPKDGTIDLTIEFNPLNPEAFEIDNVMAYMEEIGSGQRRSHPRGCPHLHKRDGVWVCTGKGAITAHGSTPGDAYQAWLRHPTPPPSRMIKESGESGPGLFDFFRRMFK